MTADVCVAVVTIVHGRHDHLALQRAGLGRQIRPPHLHVVVTMDDDVHLAPLPGTRTSVVAGPGVQPGGLPLAAARNLGARTALEAGADVLVFLDVDCVPAPAAVGRLADVAAGGEDALWCGVVAYLPPPGPGGYDLATIAADARPHAARPVPADGEVLDGDHRLFWSLSFAVTARTWDLLGGFCERYVGYGAEDTDLGETARARGIALRWVGGAAAFHQHHPTSSPPVQHVQSIVANAAVFCDRWGWWPMTGWLEAFGDLGLVERAGDGWTLRASR